MTPEQYCLQKAAISGSAFYYSTRKLKPAERQAVIAIMAFYQEIEDVTLDYTDPGIAHTKLNWWRDEVIKIEEGQPTHPVALALQKSLPPFAISSLRLIELIDGLEQNLASVTFETFEDVMIHFMRTAGKRELLIADVFMNDASVDPEVIYQLALVIELTHYLQHLRRYIRRGLIYFAQEELRQFQVQDAAWLEFRTTENIKKLLQFQTDKINRAYQRAQERLILKQRESLANLIIRCDIARAVLRAIQSSEFSVLENLIDITPLRRWWIAYTAV